jgi:hypothetical protein
LTSDFWKEHVTTGRLTLIVGDVHETRVVFWAIAAAMSDRDAVGIVGDPERVAAIASRFEAVQENVRALQLHRPTLQQLEDAIHRTPDLAAVLVGHLERIREYDPRTAAKNLSQLANRLRIAIVATVEPALWAMGGRDFARIAVERPIYGDRFVTFDDGWYRPYRFKDDRFRWGEAVDPRSEHAANRRVFEQIVAEGREANVALLEHLARDARKGDEVFQGLVNDPKPEPG